MREITDKTALLERLLKERILVLDGAMGTMIQAYKLDEDGYRGPAACGLHGHTHDLKGDNDLLVLTRPEIVREIHNQFLEAGADIIETNTFNATRIAQADYKLEARVRDINFAAASIARECADAWTAKTPDKPRFVAGALGPTNRTATISPDVNDPGFRNVSFDELVAAYTEAIDGLVEGGADLLLVETIFDTLNAKAALFAIDAYFEAHSIRLPLIVSGHDHRCFGAHALRPDARGVLGFGAPRAPARRGAQLRARRGADAPLHRGDFPRRGHVRFLLSERRPAQSDERHRLRRNAGDHGAADRGFRQERLRQHRRRLLRNDARAYPRDRRGGREAAAAEPSRATKRWRRRAPDPFASLAAAHSPSRSRQTMSHPLKLAGLEPLTIGDDALFVNVGERTNVTGSRAFAKLILAGDFAAAVEVARQQVQNGAQMIDVNMDEAMLDSKAAMVRFLNLIAGEPDIARVPVMIDSSKWEVIEAGLKCVQGKPVVNSISMKEGEAQFLHQAKLVRRYGAAAIVMAFDEKGQADTFERKVGDLPARVRAAHAPGRLSRRGHHLRPEHLRDRDRHRGAQQLRGRLHQRDALDQAAPAARQDFGRRLERQLLVSRQRRGARGDPHRVPVSRDQGRHDHGHRQRRPARRLRRARPGAEASCVEDVVLNRTRADGEIPPSAW